MATAIQFNWRGFVSNGNSEWAERNGRDSWSNEARRRAQLIGVTQRNINDIVSPVAAFRDSVSQFTVQSQSLFITPATNLIIN